MFPVRAVISGGGPAFSYPPRSRDRTEAEYLCRWSGTTLTAYRFKKLVSQEPAPLDAYRYIVEHGSSYQRALVAERLGKIGDARIDADLLRRVKAVVEAQPSAKQSTRRSKPSAPVARARASGSGTLVRD